MDVLLSHEVKSSELLVFICLMIPLPPLINNVNIVLELTELNKSVGLFNFMTFYETVAIL